MSRSSALRVSAANDELLMAMTLHVLAGDGAFEHIQRGKQRGGAVALVVVGHGGAAALLHGQAGLGAVEGLDLGFLIDRQHHRMGGRRHVKADDRVKLLDEGGVIGQLEAAPAVRRQAMLLPDVLDRGDGHSDSPRHRPDRPVGRLGWRRRQGETDHLGDPVLGDRRLACRPRPVAQQPVDACLHEPFLPTPHARLRLAGGGHDAGGADAIGGQKHDPGTPDVFLPALRIGDDGLKTPAIGGQDRNGYACAHDADSHRPSAMGIPGRTLLFRSIH